jgi:pimeloyl-ACP methyl ester carboxylesterase
MEPETFEAYLDQWRGSEGQRIYLRKDELLDEEHTAEFEPMLASVETPVRILWGEFDAWLDPTIGERLSGRIPTATFETVPEAGHFVMEDAPEAVASELDRFFRGESA